MPNSAINQQVQGLATTTSPGLAQAGFYNILPAGLVFPFAGTTVPDGFLECAGQEVSKTTYATLYASLGDTYATQTNPLTGSAWAAPGASNFRLPDYRGSFLRGVGAFTDGVGTDTTLGGYQGDQAQGHRHHFGFQSGSSLSTVLSVYNTAGNGIGTLANGVSGLQGDVAIWNPISDGPNGTPRTGKETRVRNKGVRYIIKV